MRRRLTCVIAMATGLVVASTANAQFTDAGSVGVGPVVPGVATFNYDPATGDVYVNGGGELLIEFEWKIAEGSGMRFNVAGATDTWGQPPLGVQSDVELYEINVEGFSELYLGAVLPPALTFDDVNGSTTIKGSFLGGGALDTYVATSPHFCVCIPEPSSAALFGFGTLGTPGDTSQAFGDRIV